MFLGVSYWTSQLIDHAAVGTFLNVYRMASTSVKTENVEVLVPDLLARVA